MPPLFRISKPVPAGRFLRGAVLVAGLTWMFALADELIAQEPGGAAVPAPGGSGNVVVNQPFPWAGMIVTLVMAGLCLFAVCRSSRRN